MTQNIKEKGFRQTVPVTKGHANAVQIGSAPTTWDHSRICFEFPRIPRTLDGSSVVPGIVFGIPQFLFEFCCCALSDPTATASKSAVPTNKFAIFSALVSNRVRNCQRTGVFCERPLTRFLCSTNQNDFADFSKRRTKQLGRLLSFNESASEEVR
jgi:hypothetical protein